MARKERQITIQDREQELTFKIREMPATQLEGWIIRALLLLAGSGVEMPCGAGSQADIDKAGEFLRTKGLAALGGLDYAKVKPLLDDILGCCARVIERVEERCTPETVDAYIQDVKTLLTLRGEALRLNLGFLQGVAADLSGSPVKKPTGTQ